MGRPAILRSTYKPCLQRYYPVDRLIRVVLSIFFVLAASHVFSADELENNAIDASLDAIDWIGKKRNYWGQIVGNTGRRLDGFFAGADAIEKTNDSFVKIALKGRQEKGGRSRLDPSIKFRLDLPTVEERLKLVIESEAEENISLSEKQRVNEFESEQKVSDTAIGSLKLRTQKSHKWNASTSVGAEFQLPMDFFWRAKGNYRWQINPDWNLNIQENIYYFHQDGWGETTGFTFERTGNAVVFRSKSEAKYAHTERRMEFAQTYSFLKELSTIRALNFQFGVLGENKPKAQTTAYFINTIYRRKLSHEWLFYEMTPELVFAREDNFKMSPAISAKIEIVFSSSQ